MKSKLNQTPPTLGAMRLYSFALCKDARYMQGLIERCGRFADEKDRARAQAVHANLSEAWEALTDAITQLGLEIERGK